jgi:glycylpeptide N-tetradecanoyltransferase
MKLSVYDKEITVYNISYLCIDKEYRNNNLAEIMFKEMFRRTYIENVYQNVFVSKRLIPKPFSESTYYYIIFDEIFNDKDKNFNIIKNKQV